MKNKKKDTPRIDFKDTPWIDFREYKKLKAWWEEQEIEAIRDWLKRK